MDRDYPRNFKDLVNPIKKELFIIVVLSVIGAISILVAPVALTVALSKIMSGKTDAFIVWIIIAALGIVFRQIFNVSSLGYAHVVEAKFRYTLRKGFSDKLSRLPLGFFSDNSSGAIRKYISEDTIKIHTLIAHGFSELSASIALPVGCILVMLIFDWIAALIITGSILFILIVGFMWMSISSRNMGDINLRYEHAQREMSHSAVEMVDGIKEIKNFGLSGSLFKRFDEALNKFSKTSFEWLGSSSKAIAFMISAVQPSFTLFMSLVICVLLAQNNLMSPENIILFMLLAMVLPSSLLTLMQIGNNIRDGKHSLETILSVYDKKDQVYKEEPKEFMSGDIEFDNVSFSYDDENYVLKNTNCLMGKGKLTALVGPSGGGKTTMARMIARFWDVSKGTVRIGGVDVRDLSEQDLLSHISLVFQDISLMHASIRDNISLSNPKASMEEIISAAKSAMIHEKIMELPQGYDSIYGDENIFLSGGERQRLTIARAFLADSPILILDEATAHADAESELEIQKALSLLSRDKTVIMIAHKLESIVSADQILVIDGGDIKERGRHEELIHFEGIYSRMWNSQINIKGGV